MKELNEYRAHLMDKLVSVTKEYCEVCLAIEDPFARLGENEWNAHQIATHTRDVHTLVYRFRVERTAKENDPEFKNFDGDAYMVENYDANEPLSEILGEFMASVQSLVLILSRLPVEAWSRESHHATFGGGFTLQTWVERDLAHIETHLAAIQKSP
jgi:hypothetical protein